MNGVGLTTVGRLLGHRERRTTAIYGHLDDAAFRMPPRRPPAAGRHRYPMRRTPGDASPPEFMRASSPVAPDGPRTPLWLRSGNESQGGGRDEPDSGTATEGAGDARKSRGTFVNI